MSTKINVTVDSGGLTDRAKQQQQAARQAQLEKERTLNLSAEALDKRVAAQAAKGQSLDGQPLYTAGFKQPQVDRRPAATRFGGGRGEFGYLPAGGSNYGYYDAYTEEAYISPTTPIKYSSKKFGVIKLANPSMCLGNSDPGSYLFAGRATELLAFVRAGGVLWIQNEWQVGCGIPLNIINPYLQNLFNCSIQFGLGEFTRYNQVIAPVYGQCDANFLAYEATGFTAPAVFYTDLCSPILNGTPMYSHPTVGAVVAFEKINKGFIVLSADSNATVEFPIGIFAGQEYTIIDALRTLR